MSAEMDARLDEVLIGGREERPIVIVDSDDEWPKRFEQLAYQIKNALGNGALSVEHIGSTAVPGLAAKPIIDMLLIVPDVTDESAYVTPLESKGFFLRVREPRHRMLRTTEKDVHVHVLEPESEEIDDYRDLRDWLRINSADRGLYATTKERLAQQRWSDMNYYADAKSAVVQQILCRARDWRATKRA
ncbi:GrpB family protein [Leifsonia sp. YAF41]|uniref:GrpB family protein n=1 Tax=Leifsonia sp. YAF41 TaxID=3233086 RepID=UPI003F9E8E97